MADKEMPLILDNGLPMPLDGVGDVGDVDDLFGDAGALPLRQPSKQIDLKMDKMRNRGSCKTVSWSKVGTIATITPDGQELEIRFLRSHPATGEFDLSEPATCNLVRGTPEDPLVHLEWSETNNPELAVFDNTGRLNLLIFSNNINHPFLMRKPDGDLVDDTHAVVGSHWLANNTSQGAGAEKPNRQNYNILYGPANKTERGYQYDSSFIHAESPSHPQAGRTILLAVTAGGILKMYWMQANSRPEESRLELESMGTADELITHAAFATEKKHLVLALVTASRQLKFLKIEIQWGAQPGKGGGAQNTRFTATLVEKHWAATSLLDDSTEDISTPEVSHLFTLPSLLDNSGKDTVPPMIIAVRARTTNNGAFPATQSIIDRWEAVEQKHNVHSALEQLGNRRNSISSDPSTTVHLRPLDPIILDKCIIGIQSAQFGKVVILSYADGSVQYRDRFTFEEIYAERSVDSVINLRQVGWTFPDDSQCQQVAFSPTFCSMVQQGENGKLKWSKLYFPDGHVGESMKDENYGATIAALTVTAATAIKYQNNFDDILAVVRPYATKTKFMQDWVGELIRILSVQVDYVLDPSHDALLKNASLPSCLAILMNLGFRGDMRPRMFQSAFCQLLAYIRSVAFNITVAINAQFNVGGRKSPLDDHEVAQLLNNQMGWSLGLFGWIADSLFDLMNDDEFIQRLTRERAGELAPYLEKKSNVALHLVLCSSSRTFLVALCRRVAHVEGMANRAVDFYRKHPAGQDANGTGKNNTPQLRQAYTKLQQTCSAGMVRANDFEKLVNAFGSAINQSYDAFLPKMVKNQPNPPQGKEEDEAVKTARARLESQMLMATGPPVGFLPVLKKFFTSDLPTFRRATDPAKLFFATYSVLEVHDDHENIKGIRTSQLDAFSKTKLIMRPGHQWRRCVRCTAVMEEAGTRGPGFTFLVTQQRRCPCSGIWAILAPGKLEI